MTQHDAICWRGFGEKYEYINSGVYFIKPTAKDTPIKIGRACDIERRLKELQTYEKLQVVCVCKYDRQEKLETAFHQVFHLRRIKIDLSLTEWFNITVEDIKKLLSSEEVIKCLSTEFKDTIQFTPFIDPSHVQLFKSANQLDVSENDTLLCLLLDHLVPSSEFLWNYNMDRFLNSPGMSKKTKRQIEENVKGICYHFPLFRHIDFFLFTHMLFNSTIERLLTYTNVGSMHITTFYDTRPDLYSIFKSNTVKEAKEHPHYAKCLIPESQKPKVTTSKPTYSK